MTGLNINPWMQFTFGKSYDANIVTDQEAKFKFISPVTPEFYIDIVSSVFVGAEGIIDGLSPVFTTGDQQSIDNAFSLVLDWNDKCAEADLRHTQVDYIFALSYSSREVESGNWQLVKDIWDEACAVVLKVVGRSKTVRFWVDKVDRKRRQNPWSWAQIYPYLAFPVVAVVETFPDRTGTRSFRMWPAMECTAGLLGFGLFCSSAPKGSGPVLQTVVQREGFLFNQSERFPRSMEDIMTCFSAHVHAHRFRDYATLHAQAFVNLLDHHRVFVMRRNIHGAGTYGPLQVEELSMSGRSSATSNGRSAPSHSRHEICSARWQPMGNRGWSNDSEWLPMESGVSVQARLKNEDNVHPDFQAQIFTTGDDRLDQRLACVENEHGRKVLLLLEDNGGPHGRVAAYFRYPSFLTAEQAVRIAWPGPCEQRSTPSRDQVQWPRELHNTEWVRTGIMANQHSANQIPLIRRGAKGFWEDLHRACQTGGIAPQRQLIAESTTSQSD